MQTVIIATPTKMIVATIESLAPVATPQTEAALASVRFGFAELGLKRIIGLVRPENVASARVLEKTGLRYVETVTFWEYQFSKYVITP